MTARLFALLVGIDDYPAPVPPLRGCINDVTAFAEVLQGRAGDAVDVRILTDEAATRSVVTSAIRDHLGQAGPDDVALLYFSGHGSQQRAPQELWAIEPDRRNETIVLHDSRQSGSWDLADKELAVLLGDVALTGCHVVTVLDCCHSGGGTRTGESEARLRLAPEDERVRPLGSFLHGVAALAGESDGTVTRAVRSRWLPAAGSQILLAACRSSEKAKEVNVHGRSRGALSAALERTVRDTRGPLTYRQVLRHVTAAVMQRVPDQHPQVEAPDPGELDRAFLGGVVPAAPRQLTLSHSPAGWGIDIGAVHGIPQPIGEDTTELAVYPLAGSRTSPPITTAVVTRVLADRALVRLSADLDTSVVYGAVVTAVPLEPLTIGVVGDGMGSESLRRAAAVADQSLIRLVPDDEGVDVVVEAVPEGFTITRPGVSRPLVPVVRGDHAEERAVAALEHVARWLRLSTLHNPATRLREGALEVDVRAGEFGSLGADGRLEIAYAAGLAPTFTVRLANATDQPLWGALIDLTETYGIFTDAFAAGSVALAPGESVEVALSGQVSDALWEAGTTTVTDQLKVVTSTLEFDPRSLEQEELDVTTVSRASVTRGERPARSTLERLLAAVTTRRRGVSEPGEQVADWRTDDVYVITSRPRP